MSCKGMGLNNLDDSKEGIEMIFWQDETMILPIKLRVTKIQKIAPYESPYAYY